uniref:HNH domain-containing protein n=1 Tax=viral metagenome TaxID=1070528 RepID=A0A6C0CGE7_9ZZZZ
MHHKAKIPKALREQVWLSKFGKVFEAKCFTPWCENRISVFDFQCGHDIPESKGGATVLSNLYPICARCNMSMSNVYTFQQWALKGVKRKSWLLCFCGGITCIPPSDTKENGSKSSPSPTSQNDKPIK